jgi:hypothetical protein
VAVIDHGVEALRKAANQITPGDGTEYYLATKIIDAIEGSFSPSGLKNEFKVTTLEVTTTASKVPNVALTDRNSIIIYNTDTVETLYLGPANTVEANSNIGTTAGWPVAPKSYFSTDVTDGIDFWAIVANGTVKVQVLEVS